MRVNAEQAPKQGKQEPTRRGPREGRSEGESTSERISFVLPRYWRQHADKRGQDATREAAVVIRSQGQQATGESQAGPLWVAVRPVVPMKPGNAGGGKGPSLKTNATSDEEGGIGDEQPRKAFRSYRRRYTTKRRNRLAFASMPWPMESSEFCLEPASIRCNKPRQVYRWTSCSAGRAKNSEESPGMAKGCAT